MKTILILSCAFVIPIIVSPGVSALAMANQTAPFDDWVVAPSTHPLCGGYYHEQPLPFPGQTPKYLESQPTTITADEGQFSEEGNSTLKGHVHLIQGNRQIFSDTATIHRNPRKQQTIDTVQAQGHLKITEPGLRITGTEGTVDMEKETQVVKNADYRLYNRHARGTADTLVLKNHHQMILKNASYTTCSPTQNTWQLKSKDVVLNKTTGRGRAKHSRLYVYNVPIFYWPYVDFPIDDRRQTGFLIPSYGTSSRSGLELAVPFYWNLAPQYDATITPRIFAKRGLEMQGLFRYLSSHSQGELEGSFLPNDHAYRIFRRDQLSNLPTFMTPTDPRRTALQKDNNNRSAFRIQNSTRFNLNWDTNLQYQTVGDDNYFMDFSNNVGIASTTQLRQQADLNFQSEHWNTQTRIQQYQTLHPFEGPLANGIYRRIPSFAFQNNYPDMPLGFEWSMNGEFSRFLHEPDPLTGNPFTTGDRFQLRPSLALPFFAPGWFIKPQVQLDFLSYSLSVGTTDRPYLGKAPSRVLPIFDLDSGLIFERSISFMQNAYAQTLEPRLYYLYVPFHDQNNLPNFDTGYSGFDYNQFYRDNRFNGLDRLGDANQVTFSLTSRIITEKTGQERFSITGGQIIYFKENRVTSCNPKTNALCLQQEFPDGQHHYSALVGLAKYALSDIWTLSGNLQWDPYQKEMDKEAFNLQYHPTHNTVINVGYQFLRSNPTQLNPTTQLPDRLRQTDTSFAWPITEKWRALGRWHYDIHNRRSNDISLGLEQQGCCTAVRLLVSRYIQPYDITQPNFAKRYNNAVFLQFVFKGFAGVGSQKINNTLKRAIPDYQWQEAKD